MVHNYELSPTLDGLNLQVQETLANYHSQQKPSCSSTSVLEPDEAPLPKISAGFSLAGLVTEEELFPPAEIVVLSDSD